MVILIGLLTVLATFLGGIFALRFRDKLHLILGFSAGAVIGVAFFDLLPEALELAGARFDIPIVTSVIALGFMIFLLLDRWTLLHIHTDEHCENQHHKGRLGASSLAVHSFLDGLAIGLGFQVSNAVGVIIATAVLVHDFSDGINTVGLILKNRGSNKEALRWLGLDAAAPLIGVLVTFLFTIPQDILGLILAVFTGFFLYIGASDLLPESHHAHPAMLTTVMTVLGLVVMYGVIRLAQV